MMMSHTKHTKNQHNLYIHACRVCLCACVCAYWQASLLCFVYAVYVSYICAYMHALSAMMCCHATYICGSRFPLGRGEATFICLLFLSFHTLLCLAWECMWWYHRAKQKQPTQTNIIIMLSLKKKAPRPSSAIHPPSVRVLSILRIRIIMCLQIYTPEYSMIDIRVEYHMHIHDV